jgi:hypothetical protein
LKEEEITLKFKLGIGKLSQDTNNYKDDLQSFVQDYPREMNWSQTLELHFQLLLTKKKISQNIKETKKNFSLQHHMYIENQSINVIG